MEGLVLSASTGVRSLRYSLKNVRLHESHCTTGKSCDTSQFGKFFDNFLTNDNGRQVLPGGREQGKYAASSLLVKRVSNYV